MDRISQWLTAGCQMACLLFATTTQAQKQFTVQSPDKRIEVRLQITDSIRYSLLQDGKPLLRHAAVSFHTDLDTRTDWKITSAAATSHKGILQPLIHQKSATIPDEYQQLQITFTKGSSLEWRVYNNGIAWRWLSRHHQPHKILDEQAIWSFDQTARTWYPEENSFYSHNERAYRQYRLDTMPAQKLASLPALFESQGIKLLITESDLLNYAGMWLRSKGAGQINATFPAYPAEKKITSDRDEQVLSRQQFIAKANGPQSFPWRIVMIATEDKALLSNQLVYQLASPATGDYSWVKPGKVQWDWWHYNNIYNVDFKAGINNDTYKYYIDFAAKYGIEYVLLDEGWCDTRDLMKQSPGINIEELATYARQKKVDLLLWTSWLVLDRQLDTALNQFATWGIKGIKVDFMQRDDQEMVNYYTRVATAAAKRQMLVDFHGAYKPTGWLRTFPNILTSEGVLGNEISKFAGSIDPEHTTTIPFIRMAAGPMDFTPGGMRNTQKNAWAAVPAEPMTLGTRCNQLAMYVVYESPLQMLCDIPTHYYKEPEAMAFLQSVPVVWQQTIPLQARIGDYVAIARQAANDDWYIGAMTDWSPRDLSISLSFLPPGQYKMQVWKDGINADRNARDFKTETLTVNSATTINIKMAKGGGYVAKITRKND